jgi:hypothetical protein
MRDVDQAMREAPEHRAGQRPVAARAADDCVCAEFLRDPRQRRQPVPCGSGGRRARWERHPTRTAVPAHESRSAHRSHPKRRASLSRVRSSTGRSGHPQSGHRAQ